MLRRAQTNKTDPGRRHDVDAMIARGQCWKLVEQGAIVGALVTTESGNGDLWVSMATGRAQCDLVAVLADHLREHAAGRYRSIGFQTARRGLVEKAKCHGYNVEAFIMRKTL